MTDDFEIGFDEDLPLHEMAFCLCGRDPEDPGVRAELIRVLALGKQYGIVMDGCLSEVACVFDALHRDLMPDAARELDRAVSELEEGMDWSGPDVDPVISGPRLN